MDNSFILTEFVPLGLTLERIGPFQDRVEYFDFRDEPGEPSNYFLFLSGNGRGKTHILETMAALMGVLGNHPEHPANAFGFEPLDMGEGRAQLDFRASYASEGASHTIVFSIFGGKAESEIWFKPWTQDMLLEVRADRWHNVSVIRRGTSDFRWAGMGDNWSKDFVSWIADSVGENVEAFASSPLSAPTMIYFPAYRDIVKLPQSEHRAIEPPSDWNYRPLHVFRQEGRSWTESLDNLLVWMLWLDDGRYDAALEFVNEFMFADSDKELLGIPNRNELVAKVRTLGSIPYRLDQLSSGEKSLMQIFLRVGAHMTRNTILIIDEVDAHLHTQWRSRISLRLKEMLRRNEGLSVYLASHAMEIIDSLAIEVDEPNLRKSAAILESPEEEERAQKIQEEVAFLKRSFEGDIHG